MLVQEVPKDLKAELLQPLEVRQTVGLVRLILVVLADLVAEVVAVTVLVQEIREVQEDQTAATAQMGIVQLDQGKEQQQENLVNPLVIYIPVEEVAEEVKCIMYLLMVALVVPEGVEMAVALHQLTNFQHLVKIILAAAAAVDMQEEIILLQHLVVLLAEAESSSSASINKEVAA